MIDGDKMKITLINKDDERLKIPCDEVNDFENENFYQDLINQMTEISLANHAFAASAPQFGINKRFILILNSSENTSANNSTDTQKSKEICKDYEIIPYFNPKSTAMKGLQYYYEGCMSIKGVLGKVARPYYIEFDYQDINGNHYHKISKDFEAIVICHEIDHLDGILFTDKAEDLIYNVDSELKLTIRNKHPKVIISKDIQFNQKNM